MFSIYAIRNIRNNKCYIGSTSMKLEARWRCHRSLLRRNKHPNRYLQAAWNKDGECSFHFMVIESNITHMQLALKLEGQHIVQNGQTYNLRDVAGSNLGCKHAPAAKTRRQLRGRASPNFGRRHTSCSKKRIGEAVAGERNPRARLTEEDVRRILLFKKTGSSAAALAEMYGVHQSQIYRICAGIRWHCITEES